MKRLINRSTGSPIILYTLVGFLMLTAVVSVVADARALGVKSSTGNTFDLFCDIYGETNNVIRKLATNGKCLAMLEAWVSKKAGFVKTIPGSTVKWVIPYFNFGAVDSKLPAEWHDAKFFDRYVRNGHPEWALREATHDGCDGREIILRIVPTQRIMDIGSVGSGKVLDLSKYVDRWILEVLSNYSQRNWDGVWADNVNSWNPWMYAVRGAGGIVETGVLPCNPRTGKTYTEGQWNTDLLRALKRVEQFFSELGLIFLAQTSGTWWRGYDEKIKDMADTVLVLQIENFAINYNKKPLKFRDWKEQMAVVQDILKNRSATVVFRTVKPKPTPDDKFFRDASYLLVKEANMMQRANIGQGTDAIESWWLSTDLGSHQGDMSVVPGTEVRRRNFTKGKVLVNPHDKKRYTIDLGETYIDVRTGKEVTSVTLEPKSGIILVKEPKDSHL